MKKLRMQESARKMKNINNWYFIIKIYWKLQLYYLIGFKILVKKYIKKLHKFFKN